MKTNNDEHLIYLKDLLFCALHQWKHMLVCGLFLAILLGGLKGLSAYRTVKDAETNPNVPSQTEQAQEEYKAKKEALEYQLTLLEQNVKQQTAYLGESVLMQANPFKFYEAFVCIYVDTDYSIIPKTEYQHPDLTNTIISIYSSMLTGETAIKEISNALEIDTIYLPELINISTSQGINTLLVRAKYADSLGAEQLLELLIEQLASIHTNISQVVQPHELHIVEKYVRQTSDPSLLDHQMQQKQHLQDLKASVESTQTALAELVLPQSYASSTAFVVKTAVIYAVIGGILGIFLTVLIAWITHIASSKVYSARTLFNRTNIRILGCLNTICKLDWISAKLRLLEGRCLSDSSTEAGLIAANVRNLCQKGMHILVAGNDGTALVADALRQAMPDNQITECGSFFKEVQSFDALALCDYVVLIEKCGVSRYEDIQKSQSLIEDSSKKLLGCVLLNG